VSTAIVWFRQDLRLTDHPALAEAAALHRHLVPVFIWSPGEEGDWPPGGASRWWLHGSLGALDADLRRRGSRLVLRRGPAARVLLDLVRETGADTVWWTIRYEPALRARDRQIVVALRAAGVRAAPRPGRLLHDPRSVRTGDGEPYTVFTPFWRRAQETLDTEPVLGRPRLGPSRSPASWPASLPLAALGLEPRPDRAAGLRETWTPGEAGARRRLERFLDGGIAAYGTGRDQPGRDATSMLSPHLHHGELSPREVWNAVRQRVRADGRLREGAAGFLRQLGWREFGYHLLFHFPQTATAPLRERFAAFPWEPDAGLLRAWQRGRTGYPLVDAGMRQLWRTGWMHNRVRMAAASFLTKHLLQPWLEGARWFWDTLVDADLANNTLGWQWTAGSGADAQPYFRIFNPVVQGRRYDGSGDFVRRWLPQLAALPDRWVHGPFEAPEEVLSTAGVTLGRTYPRPIVAHAAARERALAAWDRIR
jgi:deoxyribodipyrimidine photo-lyase